MTLLGITELEDLDRAITERLDGSLLPVLSKANRTGDLSTLLELFGMSDLLPEEGNLGIRPTKVVVLGDSMVQEGQLRSIARKKGFDTDLFEFALGYGELKHYKFSKLRNSYTYKAVLAGPMPHSTAGKGEASSAIAEMEAHPEIYPPVIRLTDSNGLKITNKSFTKGLAELEAMG